MSEAERPNAPSASARRVAPAPVVGIGASAGGLEALREMLSAIRAPAGLTFVVVQHLDPNYESMLAQLLGRHTDLEVLQCEGGERIEPEKVYIIPPGRGLVIRDGVLELTDFPQPRGLRRPIDDFFISLASDQQDNAACVILSGTGADGSTGLRAIKENGGVCVVQQPETARYDGMPVSAVGTGLVDFVEPPSRIAECLKTFFQRRESGVGEGGRDAEIIADHLDDLCRVIRAATGHDFSGYKRSTLIRRVERRMHVLGIDSVRSYLGRIRHDVLECEAIFRDLLINVTRFFRDGEHFEQLRSKVIRPLLEDRDPEEDIRVWVPGCSSGEEAHSIAMLFAEVARSLDVALPLQIFATDIDEQMLSIARNSSYPASVLADIPSPLRERYTQPKGDRFVITPEIRDYVRFSNHSLVKDPPFSRVDLISCRNLLIYMDERLQQTVVPLFHYALRPGGYLFLGPSETVGRFDQLFPVVDDRAKLFVRSPGAPKYPINLPGGLRQPESRSGGREQRRSGLSASEESLAIQRIAERYGPASMVLDQDGAIIAAFGRLGPYFDFPVTRSGGSSAITLARPGLKEVLGASLRRARDERRRTVVRDVEVTAEHGVQSVEVICDPLADRTILLVIRDIGGFRVNADPDLVEIDPSNDHTEALEEELRLTRHRLRSAVEELETANEELKSSNEEMMSMNEELQSTNEELSTVNDELKSKVQQLTVANADLRNFLDSTELAVVVLDSKLAIRSFTQAAKSIFPLQPSDHGRPLAHVASFLEDTDYLEDAQRVAEGGAVVQRRVTTNNGLRSLSLRVLPYRLHDGTIDGASLVLTDITDALSLQSQLTTQRQRLDLAIRAGGIGVWEYDSESASLEFDELARTMLGLDRDAATAGIDSFRDRIEEDDRDTVEQGLRRSGEDGTDFEARFRVRNKDGGPRWIRSIGRPLREKGCTKIVGVSIDVSPEFALAETRELMLREMNHRVKNLFAIIGGLISIGARSHSDVARFAADMRERIMGLGRAHSLVAPAGGVGDAELQALIETTLAPYRSTAGITIEGPSVGIQWRNVAPLALILHEWATNAMKYGVLGSNSGELSVRWRMDETGLELTWVERHAGEGTGDHPGFLAGFGTTLVETSARQLGARLDRSWDGPSFVLKINLPEASLAYE